MSSAFTTVELKPTPGFVVKSSTTIPYLLPAPAQPQPPRNPNLLEPAEPAALPVPAGLKVFINIAWDAHVPPPPTGSEEVIQRAMLGEDEDEYSQAEGGGYYVPVVVSDGRTDTDKKGARALVFDAVFHTSVKARTMRDEAFKTFIIGA